MIIVFVMLMLILSMRLSKIDNSFFNTLRKYQGPLGILGGTVVLLYFICTEGVQVFSMVPGLIIVASLIQWRIDVKKTGKQKLNH